MRCAALVFKEDILFNHHRCCYLRDDEDETKLHVVQALRCVDCERGVAQQWRFERGIAKVFLDGRHPKLFPLKRLCFSRM